MSEENKKALTSEEVSRKEKIRTRLFAVLVVLDIALVAYLVYEMISIFVTKKPS